MLNNKKLNSFCLMVIFCFTSTIIAQDEYQGIYEFESAVIKMIKTTSNQMVETKITETIYVDKNGAKEARYINEVSSNKMVDQKTEKNSLIITDGDWIYNIDLDNNTGTKMKNIKKQFMGGMDKSDMEKMAKEITGSMNADVKKIGEKEIAGVMCSGSIATTNFAGMKSSTTSYLYKNFVFLNESETMGTKIEERVVEFNEDVKVDKEKLKVPKNIMMKEMKLPFGN